METSGSNCFKAINVHQKTSVDLKFDYTINNEQILMPGNLPEAGNVKNSAIFVASDSCLFWFKTHNIFFSGD